MLRESRKPLTSRPSKRPAKHRDDQTQFLDRSLRLPRQRGIPIAPPASHGRALLPTATLSSKSLSFALARSARKTVDGLRLRAAGLPWPFFARRSRETRNGAQRRRGRLHDLVLALDEQPHLPQVADCLHSCLDLSPVQRIGDNLPQKSVCR